MSAVSEIFIPASVRRDPVESGNLYAPPGTVILNRAPLPGSPVSWMVIPVNCKNLPGKEEPGPGVLPETLIEDLFLLIPGNPLTILFTEIV